MLCNISDKIKMFINLRLTIIYVCLKQQERNIIQNFEGLQMRITKDQEPSVLGVFCSRVLIFYHLFHQILVEVVKVANHHLR